MLAEEPGLPEIEYMYVPRSTLSRPEILGGYGATGYAGCDPRSMQPPTRLQSYTVPGSCSRSDVGTFVIGFGVVCYLIQYHRVLSCIINVRPTQYRKALGDTVSSYALSCIINVSTLHHVRCVSWRMIQCIIVCIINVSSCIINVLSEFC